MNLGLCLAGGGVKGAAHIGALKAFEEKGIKFSYISGTSSGSIVATLYAAGYSSDEIYVLFKKYCSKIKYVDFKNIFKAISGLLFKRKILINGLNSGEIIEKIITTACLEKKIKNIRDIKIPLLIPSVDLHTGIVYMFSSISKRGGFSDEIKYIDDIDIGLAVRGSCSYPGLFSPCPYENTELIDGGIRENVPWQETKSLGADTVISIIFKENINKNCCSNMIEVANRTIELLCHEINYHDLQNANNLIELDTPNVSLLDFSKIDELYNLGYYQTIKKIKKSYNSF